MLISIIRLQVDYNISIQQPNFQCSEHNPNDVTFRALIASHSDMEAMDIINVLQSWVFSGVSVRIYEETFYVEKDDCPLIISTFLDPTCQPLESSSPQPKNNNIVIGSVCAALIGIFLILTSSTIICLIAGRKR